MTGLLSIIKVIAIVQFIIVILLVMLAYAVRVFSYLKQQRQQRLQQKITQLILNQIEGKSPFNLRKIKPYAKHLTLLLLVIEQMDLSMPSEQWALFRSQLIETIILPRARVLAYSKIWDKRYLACQAFQLGVRDEDEPLIEALVNDATPLVAINAALIAINCNSERLLDCVINSFAQGRRVQQSAYAQIISGVNAQGVPLIIHRLTSEDNPFVKAFCYRVLTAIPTIDLKAPIPEADLHDDNLDLQLASLAYFCHINPRSSGDLLLQQLHDKHWEVRAKSASLLGDTGDEAFAVKLEGSLKDPQWWVRTNAAQALTKLGKKGMAVLERQDPTVDQYAYEVAANFLAINRANDPK